MSSWHYSQSSALGKPHGPDHRTTTWGEHQGNKQGSARQGCRHSSLNPRPAGRQLSVVSSCSSHFPGRLCHVVPFLGRSPWPNRPSRCHQRRDTGTAFNATMIATTCSRRRADGASHRRCWRRNQLVGAAGASHSGIESRTVVLWSHIAGHQFYTGELAAGRGGRDSGTPWAQPQHPGRPLPDAGRHLTAPGVKTRPGGSG